MAAFLDEVERVARTFGVHSPSEFTILGRQCSVPHNGELASEWALSAAARSELADLLYELIHCRRPPINESPRKYADWIGTRDFAKRLSRANAGSGTWHRGFVVREIGPTGRIVAEKYGVRFWVPPERARAESEPIEPGTRIRVKGPKEFRELLGGFYAALGDADEPTGASIRVYWHLHPGGAERLVASLTQSLNAAGVPFLLKVVNNPQYFDRTDAGVLYLSRSLYRPVREALSQAHREVARFLKPTVSAYVKALAEGVGVADDTGANESFGQHRSRLLATVLSSRACVEAVPAARVDLVLAEIARQGFDPRAFYLAPGLLDEFDPLSPE